MNWILLIAAVLITILVFTFLVKVLRAALGTALAIALVVLVVQLLFGVAPRELWQQLRNIWESIWRFFT